MNRKLPANMSQLDYLWTYFGNYKVITKPNEYQGENSIVSEEALKEYLKEYTNGGISELKLLPKIGSEDKLELIAYAADGSTVSVIDLDKEEYLTDVQLILSTQVEIDDNVCKKLDIPLLVFTMKSGKKYYVDVEQFTYTGVETQSIKTTIVNNRIAAHLKIDKSLEIPVVDVDITDDGLKVDLSINPDKNKQLKLVKTKNGLDTTYTWENGDNILFDILSYYEYSLLDNPVPGKIYFIPEFNCIYLNGVKYGDTLSFEAGKTIELVDGALEVKVDPDEDNLLFKTNAGLAAKLYWDE